MKKFIAPLAILLLLGAGCATTTPGEEVPLMPEDMIEETSMPEEEMPEPTVSLSGDLTDVNDGDATGSVDVMWYEEMGRYQLNATFSDLPELEEDFFYEGWVVRAEPFEAVSTGALIMESDTEWSNSFQSTKDLSEHARYVLTLEPDDGDPAPAEHVLEGNLE